MEGIEAIVEQKKEKGKARSSDKKSHGVQGHEEEAVKGCLKKGPEVKSVEMNVKHSIKGLGNCAEKNCQKLEEKWEEKKAKTIRQSIQKVQFPNKRNSVLCPKTRDA